MTINRKQQKMTKKKEEEERERKTEKGRKESKMTHHHLALVMVMVQQLLLPFKILQRRRRILAKTKPWTLVREPLQRRRRPGKLLERAAVKKTVTRESEQVILTHAAVCLIYNHCMMC